MTQPHRLASGGAVDRARLLRFRFDGAALTGYAGDTLASALLANGVRVVARSIKYHRPRGVYAAGVEEPNALVRIGDGARVIPNLPATLVELRDGLEAFSLNTRSGVRFDAARINDAFSWLLPAGFYYKTFMWPATAWKAYEHVIRRAAGLGRAPAAADPDRYDKRNAHADVLVIGGGPAGLAAASAAAARGAHVLVCDREPVLGGQLAWRAPDASSDGSVSWLHSTEQSLRSAANVTVLTRTTAVGAYDHNLVTLVERTVERDKRGLPRERLWKVRARHVILAAGAFERLMVFPGNDLPGVMLLSAAQRYVAQYAVRPARRVALFVNNDGAYDAAAALRDAGVEIACIVDVREHAGRADDARARGLRVEGGAVIAAAHGRGGVRRITVAHRGATKGTRARTSSFDCDGVLVSGGWDPAVHLYSQAGGKLAFDETRHCFLPAGTATALHVAGAAAGHVDLDPCIDSGRDAAARACDGIAGTPALHGTAPAAATPLPLGDLAPGRRKAFVDLQGDVLADDLRLAAREGFTAAEHAKRYTTTGMGIDQGKVGNIAALCVLADATARPLGGLAPTTYRPPFVPVTFGTLAGREIGSLFDPVRETPVGTWHTEAGAVLEPVGLWRRASAYPRAGEHVQAAVRREMRAVRERAGLLDASTLGKIEVIGPDAATFLDLVYCTPLASLGVGQCRYGLMLRDTGMAFDDGVVACLAPRHYLLSTTSGNAPQVADWLEEWLQCEWPHLDVRIHDVTAQWATLAVAGPAARSILAAIDGDIDLSAPAFPHLAVRLGMLAGVKARILRVSYTGELSYEINVPARYGRALWELLLARGATHGLEPVGLDAIDALRLEKGYIAIGHDTDGTVTPFDLGMDWAVSRKKADFIGKRGLQQPDLARADRKQLVGLLTADETSIHEGSPVIAWDDRRRIALPPVPMLGHVSSAAHSVALGRIVAFALVTRGRERMGERVAIVDRGRPREATIVAPRFYDAEGARLHA